MADKSIFDATLEVNNDIKRNTFDWSHQNNLTTDFGRITPVFCELVPNNSSIRIKPTFGLDFMPMVFPVQTRMKARMSFFKVPLRTLWKDYRDFVGNFRDDLEEPYVVNSEASFPKMFKTCSLGDYLGLPTTSAAGNVSGTPVSFSLYYYNFSSTGGTPTQGVQTWPTVRNLFDLWVNDGTIPSSFGYLCNSGSTFVGANGILASFLSFDVLSDVSFDSSIEPYVNVDVKIPFIDKYPYDIECFSLVSSDLSPHSGTCTGSSVSYVAASKDYFTLKHLGDGRYTGSFQLKSFQSSGAVSGVVLLYCFLPANITQNGDSWKYTSMFPFSGSLLANNSTIYSYSNEISDVEDFSALPWSVGTDDSTRVKLSAYPFRAYEAVYNAYFRDNRNNPYILDGQVQYNRWIPTDEGGADHNVYELHQANWERDFLTTAVQSPQQGQAPLVGITTYSEVSYLTLDDGTPVMTTTNKLAVVDEEGKAYSLQFSNDADGLTDVSYTPLSEGTVMKQSRSLVDLAASGISINDLRNVNAYQKFLELNMRKGYSYRDIIEGRWDVKVRYDELMMPEFIGGCTRDVVNGRVVQNQMVSDSGLYQDALGAFAGLSGVDGTPNNDIECFCDEESIIIGVLTITPNANYSQLLPKHFTYRGLLDHYQPEFNHIGFQAITMKEVSPIQQFALKRTGMDDVFGYQRPWYEYVAKIDTVHGLYRTYMRNFLINRYFSQLPQLNQQFLLVDPEQVNDVFAVSQVQDGTPLTDKIFGQIWFDCQVKLPISRVAIPRLD